MTACHPTKRPVVPTLFICVSTSISATQRVALPSPEKRTTTKERSMRNSSSWRTRGAVAAVAILALAGCGSSAKSSPTTTPATGRVTIRMRHGTTPKAAVPTTVPPQTVPADHVVPTTAAPVHVAPPTATPAQNCPNGSYVNSSGNTVCSPYQAPSVPAGATAKCGDGSYSFSQHRSGTCSHHGGVAQWL